MTIMREERREDAHDLDNVTYNLAVVVALLAFATGCKLTGRKACAKG